MESSMDYSASVAGGAVQEEGDSNIVPVPVVPSSRTQASPSDGEPARVYQRPESRTEDPSLLDIQVAGELYEPHALPRGQIIDDQDEVGSILNRIEDLSLEQTQLLPIVTSTSDQASAGELVQTTAVAPKPPEQQSLQPVSPLTSLSPDISPAVSWSASYGVEEQPRSPTAHPLNERFTVCEQVHYLPAHFPQELASFHRGHVIYDSDSVFTNGSFSLPYESELLKLGHGTNGNVREGFINEKKIALKFTEYRRTENRIWSGLCHINILPLLAVIVVSATHCCQMMPFMTCTLRDELNSLGGDLLYQLIRHPSSEPVLRYNVRFVFRSILNAMSYLSHCNIQLQDLKDRNVLIYRTCSCQSLYLCQCLQQYAVQISDFDSVRVSSESCAGTCWAEKRKLPSECAKVPGTRGYRAPEQFTTTGCRGPWCDIWSFGVCLLNQFCARSKESTVIEANTLCGKPNCHEFDRKNPSAELVHPTVQLRQLQDENGDFRLVSDAMKLINRCILVDCHKRPTADDLLADRFFTQ